MYYSANILYKSERSDAKEPLWEEKIVLISALDELEAKEKAKKYAVENEAEFNTADDVKINWKFYEIERVVLIDDILEDGAELFSRFLRDSEVKSLLTPFD